MKLIYTLIAATMLCTLLAACGPSAQEQETARKAGQEKLEVDRKAAENAAKKKLEDELKKDISDSMSDPASAQFRNLRWVKIGTTDKLVLCGELNAKNKFGGYVGFTGFAASAVGEVKACKDGEYRCGKIPECYY